MDDRTSDLTDEQLFVAADEGWRSPGSHGLRAVADLARQGWAPVGTGPSIEDLGPLIVWLGEMAIQAADAGRSDEAGMLTWASLVLGERVNEDASDRVPDSSSSLSKEIWDLISESDGVYGLHKNGDLAPWDELLPGGEYELLSSLPPFDDTDSDHIADVSNMVESALDTVYLRALQLAQGAYSQTGGLHGKELEAFRAGIATVECLLKAADAQSRKRQTTFTAFCNSSEFATALRTGGSFNAWPDPYSDCDMTIDVHIPLKLLVKPKHSNQ